MVEEILAIIGHPWFPVLMLFLAAVSVAVGMAGMAYYLGPRKNTSIKNIPYECGINPSQTHIPRISISYYVVALMFILFDIEAVFLYLWAPVFRDLGLLGLVEMGFFLGVLIIGYLYILSRGALEWD